MWTTLNLSAGRIILWTFNMVSNRELLFNVARVLTNVTKLLLYVFMLLLIQNE